MLTKLVINNFATIDHVNIDFSDGFLVLTGETGSGKSIIVGALNLISGDRADFTKLNDKTKKIIIEAEFNVSSFKLVDFFLHNDIDYSDNLIIRREVLPNGKSRSFINDTPVRLELLKSLAFKIIDIHSQHENLLINDEFFQLNFIDKLLAVENSDFLKILEDYQKKFLNNQVLKQKIDECRSKNKLQKEEFENLNFLLSEFNSANLLQGEKEMITEEYHLLNNVLDIKKSLNNVLNLFQGDDLGIISKLNNSLHFLNSISSFNKKIEDFQNRLKNNLIDAQDLSQEINLFQDRLSLDKSRLEYLVDRLNLINSLEEKHLACSFEELIQKKEKISEKISLFHSLEKEIISLEKEYNRNLEDLKFNSSIISKLRRDFSKIIEFKLIEDLKELGISDSKIKFSFEDLNSCNYYGLDSLELFFSANKGYELKPIQKVASGGELSRFMLCVKKHLFLVNNFSTIIFDEIDSGVSGKIAEKVGFLMKEISKKHQIVVITHLPQIASIAAEHYKVYKKEGELEEKNETKIKLLKGKDRVLELARLLSGHKITNEAIANAKKMLNI